MNESNDRDEAIYPKRNDGALWSVKDWGALIYSKKKEDKDMRHAISLLAKKHIMIRAWHIARYAQRKHGGKPKQYMSQALRKSWTEWKEW